MNKIKSDNSTRTEHITPKAAGNKNRHSEIKDRGEDESTEGTKYQAGCKLELASQAIEESDISKDGESEKIKCSGKDRYDRKTRRRKADIKCARAKSTRPSKIKESHTDDGLIPVLPLETDEDGCSKEKYKNKTEVRSIPTPTDLQVEDDTVKPLDPRNISPKNLNTKLKNQNILNTVDRSEETEDSSVDNNDSKYKSTKIIYTGDDSHRSIVIAYYKGKLVESIHMNSGNDKLKKRLQSIAPRIEVDDLDKIKTCDRGPVEVYTVTVEDKNWSKKKTGQLHPKNSPDICDDCKKCVKKKGSSDLGISVKSEGNGLDNCEKSNIEDEYLDYKREEFMTIDKDGSDTDTNVIEKQEKFSSVDDLVTAGFKGKFNNHLNKFDNYENEKLDLLRDSKTGDGDEAQLPRPIEVEPRKNRCGTKSKYSKSTFKTDTKQKENILFKTETECENENDSCKVVEPKHKSRKKKNRDRGKLKDELECVKVTSCVVSEQKQLVSEGSLLTRIKRKVKSIKYIDKFDKLKRQEKKIKKSRSPEEKSYTDKKEVRPKIVDKSPEKDTLSRFETSAEHCESDEQLSRSKPNDNNENIQCERGVSKDNEDDFKVTSLYGNEKKEKSNKINNETENDDQRLEKKNKRRAKGNRESKDKETFKYSNLEHKGVLEEDEETKRRDTDGDGSSKITVRLRNKSDKRKSGDRRSRNRSLQINIHDSDNTVEKVKRDFDEKDDEKEREGIEDTPSIHSDEKFIENCDINCNETVDVLEYSTKMAEDTKLKKKCKESKKKSKSRKDERYMNVLKQNEKKKIIAEEALGKRNIVSEDRNHSIHKKKEVTNKKVDHIPAESSTVEINSVTNTEIDRTCAEEIVKRFEKNTEKVNKRVEIVDVGDNGQQMKDLTIKDLYLMENLEDYEQALKERHLNKIKKSKRSKLEAIATDVSSNDKFETDSRVQLQKMPSVKEIFKITNLADYELKYKEMQERKRRRKNANAASTLRANDSTSRKKHNKFSLESKGDTMSPTGDADKSLGPLEPTSTFWLLNDIKCEQMKNRGDGEVIDWSSQIDQRAVFKDPLNHLETDHNRKIKKLVKAKRTQSQTVLMKKDKNFKSDIKRNLKPYEKFLTGLREDSRKLLETLSQNKQLNVFLKSESIQSIKKKPHFRSDREINKYNFDYVLLKKPKRNVEEFKPIVETRNYKKVNLLSRKKIILVSNTFFKKRDRLNEMIEFWNCKNKTEERASEDHRYPCDIDFATFENEYKTAELSYDIILDDRIDELPERLIVEEVQSTNSDGGSSLASYTLSMFEKEIDTVNERYVNNSVKEELGEHDCFARRLRCRRQTTLDQIIQDVEERPEKESDLFREHLKRNCEQLSDIERNENLCYSYLSHVNFDKKILEGITDRNSSWIEESLKRFDKSAYKEPYQSKETNSSKMNFARKANRQPCFDSCKFCKRMKKRRRKISVKKYSRSSVTRLKNSHKCDTKSKRKENLISAKMIIADETIPNNILHIKFCGQLNINFNKNSVSIGNAEETPKQLEVRYDLDANRIANGMETTANDSASLEDGKMQNWNAVTDMKVTCDTPIIKNETNINCSETSSCRTLLFNNKNDARPSEDLSWTGSRPLDVDEEERKIAEIRKINNDVIKKENDVYESFNVDVLGSDRNMVDKINYNPFNNNKVLEINSVPLDVSNKRDSPKEDISNGMSPDRCCTFDDLDAKAMKETFVTPSEKLKYCIGGANEISTSSKPDVNEVIESSIGFIEAYERIDNTFSGPNMPSSALPDSEICKIKSAHNVHDIPCDDRRCIGENANNRFIGSPNRTSNEMSMLLLENGESNTNHTEKQSVVHKTIKTFSDINLNGSTIGVSELNPYDKYMNSNENEIESDAKYQKESFETASFRTDRNRDNRQTGLKIEMGVESKKKLLLTHSEEEAFKYLILKGIGRTDVFDSFDCSDSIGSSQAQNVFSSIRRKMQLLRSKSDCKYHRDCTCERAESKCEKFISHKKRDMDKSTEESHTTYSSSTCDHSMNDPDTSKLWDSDRVVKCHHPNNDHCRPIDTENSIDERGCHYCTKAVFENQTVQQGVFRPAEDDGILNRHCFLNAVEKRPDLNLNDQDKYLLSNQRDGKVNICQICCHRNCQNLLIDNKNSNSAKHRYSNEDKSIFKVTNGREVEHSWKNPPDQRALNRFQDCCEMGSHAGYCDRTRESYIREKKLIAKKKGKFKFAKQASKMLNKLFKKRRRRYDEETTLNYEISPPEQLLSPQPKVRNIAKFILPFNSF